MTYPLLGRLEREGLVETHRAASDGGPPRKYYGPSNEGASVPVADEMLVAAARTSTTVRAGPRINRSAQEL
jgi:predicted transcriptional regulator